MSGKPHFGSLYVGYSESNTYRIIYITVFIVLGVDSDLSFDERGVFEASHYTVDVQVVVERSWISF